MTSKTSAAPLLFYGVPSGCSFGAIVALEWLGRPYQLCRIVMPEAVSSPAYRRINPVAETPTLRTAEGAFVSESMAILNHLGAQGIDQGLGFRQGSAAFDRLNERLAFLNTSFFGAFSPLWWALEHGREGAAKAALHDYGRQQVEQAHAALEAMLGEGPWMLGAQRTVADAYFIGIARWTKYHAVIDRRDYPRVQALFERLEADPAVVFAHAIERADPLARSQGGFQGEVPLEAVVAGLDRSA